MEILQAQGFSNPFMQYEYIRNLGDGKSSQVCLFQHKSTLEKFAIKMMPYENRFSKIEKARIKREIGLKIKCKNCPNVVRFKEEFFYENTHFIVMEYMAGGDLQ